MRRLVVLSLLLSVGVVLEAQQHPNVARGFDAGRPYQMNGIDDVNLFNGSLTVTIPIVLHRDIAGFMVTTMISDYHRSDVLTMSDEWIDIGGTVLDTLHPLPSGLPAPVMGAWVQLQSMTGTPLALTSTDELGHFLFERVQPIQYQIRAGIAGLGERTRIITVPTETGEYDVALP